MIESPDIAIPYREGDGTVGHGVPECRERVSETVRDVKRDRSSRIRRRDTHLLIHTTLKIGKYKIHTARGRIRGLAERRAYNAIDKHGTKPARGRGRVSPLTAVFRA